MYVFQKLQFSSIKPWCKLLQSNIDIISGLSLIPSLFLFSLQSVTDTKIILLKRFILLTTKSLSPKSILLTSQEKLAAMFLTHPPRESLLLTWLPILFLLFLGLEAHSSSSSLTSLHMCFNWSFTVFSLAEEMFLIFFSLFLCHSSLRNFTTDDV